MRFLLFGTGEYYNRYKKWFSKEDIVALLDNSVEKQNRMIDEICVLPPAEGIKLSYDCIVILSFYVKAMRSQLVELGIPENKIFHFYDLSHLLDIKRCTKTVQFYGRAKEVIYESPISKKILLLSQDLTLGGPAIALFHVAEVLVKHGYQVVYASMLDGPLREKLLLKDISVVVDVNLQIETMEDAEWIRSFSLIFCNTINFHVFLSRRDSNIPVIWWLHDSAFFYDGISKNMLNNLDLTNLKICSVGPVPEKAFHSRIPNVFIDKLLYAVEDTKKKGKKSHNKQDKVFFVTIGYVEERKGQDILIQAIHTLPIEIKEKAIFYLVGQNTSALAQRLKIEIERMPEVVMIGAVDREKINEILNDADVMLCPSREDPMPTVVAEAMSHEVPCVVSDVVGTSEYIHDEEDGLIFHNENVQELSIKIMWCVEHREQLREMGAKARIIYEKYFTMQVFENNLLNIVESMKEK